MVTLQFYQRTQNLEMCFMDHYSLSLEEKATCNSLQIEPARVKRNFMLYILL